MSARRLILTEQEPCPYCGGKGDRRTHTPGLRQACRACDGSGWRAVGGSFVVPEENREAALRLLCSFSVSDPAPVPTDRGIDPYRVAMDDPELTDAEALARVEGVLAEEERLRDA